VSSAGAGMTSKNLMPFTGRHSSDLDGFCAVGSHHSRRNTADGATQPRKRGKEQPRLSLEKSVLFAPLGPESTSGSHTPGCGKAPRSSLGTPRNLENGGGPCDPAGWGERGDRQRAMRLAAEGGWAASRTRARRLWGGRRSRLRGGKPGHRPPGAYPSLTSKTRRA
jgi:hypothetical protein